MYVSYERSKTKKSLGMYGIGEAFLNRYICGARWVLPATARKGSPDKRLADTVLPAKARVWRTAQERASGARLADRAAGQCLTARREPIRPPEAASGRGGRSAPGTGRANAAAPAEASRRPRTVGAAPCPAGPRLTPRGAWSGRAPRPSRTFPAPPRRADPFPPPPAGGNSARPAPPSPLPPPWASGRSPGPWGRAAPSLRSARLLTRTGQRRGRQERRGAQARQGRRASGRRDEVRPGKIDSVGTGGRRGLRSGGGWRSGLGFQHPRSPGCAGGRVSWKRSPVRDSPGWRLSAAAVGAEPAEPAAERREEPRVSEGDGRYPEQAALRGRWPEAGLPCRGLSVSFALGKGKRRRFMSLLQYLRNIHVTLKGKEPSSCVSERGENALLDSLCSSLPLCQQCCVMVAVPRNHLVVVTDAQCCGHGWY